MRARAAQRPRNDTGIYGTAKKGKQLEKSYFAGNTRVLCGKYSSTLRKVRSKCLFLISLDTFLFYKLFH